jgi:hypothetical protein
VGNARLLRRREWNKEVYRPFKMTAHPEVGGGVEALESLAHLAPATVAAGNGERPARILHPPRVGGLGPAA